MSIVDSIELILLCFLSGYIVTMIAIIFMDSKLAMALGAIGFLIPLVL